MKNLIETIEKLHAIEKAAPTFKKLIDDVAQQVTAAEYLEGASHVALMLEMKTPEEWAVIVSLMAFVGNGIDESDETIENLPDEIVFQVTDLMENTCPLSPELARKIGECVREIRQMARAENKKRG